ncbi:hypothetical protein T08_16074 [Trichinella sp. T8]|nr:hypothetical protein T08_298 [Trichinella sp. T8]KRZ86959.1 hypothetical protein T08_16074 [Trichinella sp. T8]
MSCFAIVNRLGNFLLYAPKSSFDLYHRFSNGVLQNIVTTANFLTIIPGILQTTNDVHAGSTTHPSSSDLTGDKKSQSYER